MLVKERLRTGFVRLITVSATPKMAGMPEFGIGVVPPSGPFEPRPMPVIGFAVGLYRGFGVGDLIAKPVNSNTIGIVSGGGLGLGGGGLLFSS